MEIAGKVFIVTGGASGLGEGTARMLTAKAAKWSLPTCRLKKAKPLPKNWAARL